MFDNFEQVVDLICSCPMPLDTPQFHGSKWESTDMPITDLPSPPSLKVFSHSWIEDDDLSNWLLFHKHACTGIQTFEVYFDDPDKMAVTSKFLEVIGSSLQHLMLQFWNIRKDTGEPLNEDIRLLS
jgi:hypothetical protein